MIKQSNKRQYQLINERQDLEQQIDDLQAEIQGLKRDLRTVQKRVRYISTELQGRINPPPKLTLVK